MSKTGVYICHCGENIAGSVNIGEVLNFAATLPGVAVSREYLFMCSDPGQELIRKDIEAGIVDRVVVAACTPRTHEPIFRKALEDSGLNQYLFEMANIRDQDSWAHWGDKAGATQKAQRLIASAVAKANLLQPLQQRYVEVEKSVLVVGAGVSGMFAALDLAGMGYKVWLLDRNPSVGGNMAKLDKTFPTNDCSACILTPIMVQVANHPNIELLTYSEIDAVNGSIGNFSIKIKKKQTYVDWKKCTGCGDCVNVCSVDTVNDFNEDMNMKKAVYIAFPQAVPKKALIEKSGSSPCSFTCPAGINAHGYIALIRNKKYKEAFALILETTPLAGILSRACYAPCEDQCTGGYKDGHTPIRKLKRFVADKYYADRSDPEFTGVPEITGKNVAVIGSGPAGLTAAYHLAQKGHKVKIFEEASLPGGMLRYIISSRLPGSVIDRDIKNITALGVEIETGARIENINSIKEKGYDAVFIAIGTHKLPDMLVEGENLDNIIKSLDFIKKVNSGEITSLAGKTVVVVGGGNVALDSARIAIGLGAKRVTVQYRRSRGEMPAHKMEIEIAEKEGIHFEYLTAPQKFIGDGGKMVAIETIKIEPAKPTASGKTRPVPIPGSEQIIPADMVITAIGLSPGTDCFKDQLALNGDGSIEVEAETLQTSVPYVFAGGDVVSGASMIVSAVGQGKRAAFYIDRYLRGTFTQGSVFDEKMPMVDREDVLRRNKHSLKTLPQVNRRSLDAADYTEAEAVFSEEEALNWAGNCLDCGICAGCGQCVTACSAGAISMDMAVSDINIKVGTIIVAAGYQVMGKEAFKEYSPGSPNVITCMQLERILSATGPTDGDLHRPSDGKRPQTVAFISCVGSRDKSHHAYCSKVCCMYMLKEARLIKEKYPETQVYIFFVDARTPGKDFEEYYNYCRELGVKIIRGRVGAVDQLPGDGLRVRAYDVDMGAPVTLDTDLVALATAMEPPAGLEDLGRKLGIACGAEGFLKEVHTKLYPVETSVKGIYIAGCAQGPKDIPESVSQSRAASSAAAVPLTVGKVPVEPFSSSVDQEKCSGCGICAPLCPYAAISREDIGGKIRARIDIALCAGCGVCAAACPSLAITLQGFTADQIFAQIGALTSVAGGGPID